MLSKKTRFVALLFVMVLTGVMLTGCGGDKKNADVIKIGLLNEMTGGNATMGTSSTNGAKLAFKEINEKGGILGKKVELSIADNKSEPAEAANAMTKLVGEKVVAVTGTFASSNAISSANVAEAAKVPYLASGATNPKVTVDEKTGKVRKYVFRVCFIDPFQGTVAANFMTNNLKKQTAAIIVDNSSDYSKGLAQFFKDALVANGGKVVAEEAYLQKDQDFKSILTKVKTANADVIYIPGYYEEVGKLVKQARELGIDAVILGADGWDSPKLIEIAGAQALNNTYFSNHYSVDSTDPESKAFVEKYTKEYGQRPDALSVLGYDAAYVLADAITRAGSADTEKITEEIAKTKGLKVITGKMSLNDTHDAEKSAVIIEMKDGKQVFNSVVEP